MSQAQKAKFLAEKTTLVSVAPIAHARYDYDPLNQRRCTCLL